MLLQDIRQISRAVQSSPSLFLLAIATLAIGIGGTTAIYSFVSAVLLAPLPYDDPDTLVVITRNNRRQGFEGLAVPARDVVAFRDRARSFAHVTGYAGRRVTLTGGEAPEDLRGVRILPDFLSVLGIEPALGRSFDENEHATNEPVAILGHDLWQRRFGGSADVIGQSVLVNEVEHTVVGVLPSAEGVVPTGFDILRPMAKGDLEAKSPPLLWVLARLSPGVSHAVATEEIHGILERWEEENRPPVMGWRADVTPLGEHILGDVERPLWVFFGAVCIVLLIACVNVANLLLARGAARENELAIRAAIGANRWRICRQLLAESVLLSLAGGLFGAILAYYGTRSLVTLAPDDIPRLASVGIDTRVLLFSVSVSIGTGLVAGLVPALTMSRQHLEHSLKATGQVGSIRGRRRVRAALAVLQLALALTLSIGAGLLIRSFSRLVSVEPGFETGALLTFQLSLPRHRFAGPGRWDRVAEEILARVRAVPGVVEVAASSWTPLSGGWGRAQLSVEATSGGVSEREQWPMVLGVTPSYFRALELPLLRGRDLTLDDGGKEHGVVLVNRKLAEQAWPGEDPLGKRLKFGGTGSTNPWFTVVGVVEDARLVGLGLKNEEGIFRPLLRTGRTLSFLQVATRMSIDPEQLLPQIRQAVWSVDDQLPIANVRTMQDLVSSNVFRPRFRLVVIVLFALIAVSLAAIGVYGVVSHSVTQRSREIGLRMALGADRSRVLGLMLQQGMVLVVVGVLLGVGLALGLTRVLTSFLYEVSATEPVTFFAAAATLASIGLLATLGPALRATRVDPMTTLRTE